jgi:hypothetical protein
MGCSAAVASSSPDIETAAGPARKSGPATSYLTKENDLSCAELERLSTAARGELQALAERSLKMALSIPGDEACGRLFDQRDAAFLMAARHLGVSLSTAYPWSEAELLGKAETLALADPALGGEALLGQSKAIAGGGGRSCIDDGVRAFSQCVGTCPPGSLSRVGCLVQCRQTAINSIVGCLLGKIGAVFA